VSERFDGRVVVVTGGASGIGAATVRRFVAEGARVAIADVQDGPGEDLAAELGERAEYVHTDVSREADIEALVDGVVERHGRLDVFFANAGVFGAVGSIAETRTSDVDLTIAINLRGVLLCLKHAARVMLPRGSGCIIATASPGGIIGGVGPHTYSATKAGVIGLVRSVAAELRGSGIRVNTVVPGAVVSAMTADVVAGNAADLEKAAEAMAPNAVMGRPGVPEDLAGAVAFLASDDAGFVTGTELLVDGGYTHAWGPAPFSRGTFAGSAALLEAGRRSSPDPA
jgi:NAD(P)-dependent dehydrogenase (short-subunit alcohol dehydrogenase family)